MENGGSVLESCKMDRVQRVQKVQKVQKEKEMKNGKCRMENEGGALRAQKLIVSVTGFPFCLMGHAEAISWYLVSGF